MAKSERNAFLTGARVSNGETRESSLINETKPVIWVRKTSLPYRHIPQIFDLALGREIG